MSVKVKGCWKYICMMWKCAGVNRAVSHSHIYSSYGHCSSHHHTVRAAGIKVYGHIYMAYLWVSSDSIISANSHSTGSVISKTNPLATQNHVREFKAVWSCPPGDTLY